MLSKITKFSNTHLRTEKCIILLLFGVGRGGGICLAYYLRVMLTSAVRYQLRIHFKKVFISLLWEIKKVIKILIAFLPFSIKTFFNQILNQCHTALINISHYLKSMPNHTIQGWQRKNSNIWYISTSNFFFLVTQWAINNTLNFTVASVKLSINSRSLPLKFYKLFLEIPYSSSSVRTDKTSSSGYW